MIELRKYGIDIAAQFSFYRNNPNVLDNGYDKTPNPFTLEDAINFINL